MGKEIFIFIGPPGAGKGSLSQLCIKRFGWTQLSTGNLCREHIMKETEIGKDIDFNIKSGKLIPDSLIVAMLEDWLIQTKEDMTLILDGFPRTVRQAEAFDAILAREAFKNVKIYLLEMQLSDEKAIKRLLSRMVCQNVECQSVYSGSEVSTVPLECTECLMPLKQREDDRNSEIIKERLSLYKEHKNAIFNYYHQTGKCMYSLNVERPLDSVFDEFLNLLKCREL